MGSKSGLSYTDIVHIRTRFDSIEYTYILRKGEKTPRLEKIFEEPTTERNGTLIKIYIKSVKNKWGNFNPQISEFKTECTNQLHYFNNVYFEGCDIDNDYKLIEGKHWKTSTRKSSFDELHLCLGQVAYPIDWVALGTEIINFPIALKFDIGELDIIQTREDVKYTPRTKQAIFDKIELLKQEMIDWWQNQDLEYEDLKTYIDARRKKKYCFEYKIDSSHIIFNLERLLSNDQIRNLKKWKFKPLLNFKAHIPDYALFEYKIEKKLSAGEGKLRKQTVSNLIDFVSDNFDRIYRISENPFPTKNRYIAEIEDKELYLIRKDLSVITLDHYKNNLKLIEKQIPKSEWREQIKMYQKAIQDYVISKSKSYKGVVIDPEWLKALKPRKSVKLAEGNMLVYQYGEYTVNRKSRYRSANRTKTVWRREEVKLKELQNKCVLISEKDDKERIQKLSEIFKYVNIKNYSLKVFVTAKNNLKHFYNLKNIWSVETIMSENCKPFVQVMTLVKIQKEYPNIFGKHKVEDWMNVYSFLGESLKELNLLNNKFGNLIRQEFVSNTCYEIAVQNNLFDQNLIEKAKFVDQYFKELPLINHICGNPFPSEEVARYIFMYNKSVKNPKRFKKLNVFYYIQFNLEEKNLLLKLQESKQLQIA